MSFTHELKKELALLESENPCCEKAFAYGFMLFGKSFNLRSMSCSTDYTEVMDSFVRSAKKFVSDTKFDVSHNDGGKYTLRINSLQARNTILNYFGHESNEISLRINYANFENDCCYASFVRGVFLSCGSLADPYKNYHLEFVVPYFKLSQDLLKMLTDLNFNAKYILRNYSHVIYIKESESIEDIITLMGAMNSSLKLMGIKLEKDVRNNINRQMNFESANMNRSIEAGIAQAEAIELIEKKQGLDSLPDNLRELAKIRKDNPDMSLKQLGECLSEPLSRSGVNHRLKKIMEIAESYK
ncbi:MAG: DNA-binding protein WhiA [Clostridia bacterium]|nr:DNA-binding protein WhiA [Clostridia bacterium]